MKGVNPKDIPPRGRYDLTVTKEGQMKTASGDTIPAVACMIDNGPYKGKRMTAAGFTRPPGTRFSAFVTPEATALIDGEWESVPLDYKASNPRIRYALCEYDVASAPPEREFESPRTKFHRRSL